MLSRSSQKPLSWTNSFLLGPRWADEIHELKNASGGDLLVVGSTELIRALLSHDLVDEFRLMIDPVCLGGGKKLFPLNGVRLALRLVSSRVVSTGSLLLTYSRG